MFRNLAALLVSTMTASVWATPVDIQINPTSPIVITADMTMPNGIKIKAPWYSFNVNVTNSSQEFVTVVEIQVDTLAPNGQKATVLYSPSDYNFTLTCAQGTTVAIAFNSFGTIPPGASQPLTLLYNGPALPAGCDASAANLTDPTIYIGNNPVQDIGYNYKAHAIFTGWYGTTNSPKKRFQQEINFVTQ